MSGSTARELERIAHISKWDVATIWMGNIPNANYYTVIQGTAHLLLEYIIQNSYTLRLKNFQISTIKISLYSNTHIMEFM